MTNSTHVSKGSIIEVTDFGPIASGKIELRPLTVFAGPSNTGKSWLAMLIYALQKGSGVTSDLSPVYLSRYLNRAIHNGTDFPENPASWVESIENEQPIVLSTREKKIIGMILEANAKYYGQEITRCFGIPSVENFVRKGTPKKHAKILLSSSYGKFSEINIQKSISCTFEVPKSIEVFKEQQSKKGMDRKNYILHILQEIISGSDHQSSQRARSFHLRRSLIRELLLSLQHPIFGESGKGKSAWYLPADRGGIMHAHRTVVSALVQNSARAGIMHQTPVPVLSGVLSDFLENLIGLDMSPADYDLTTSEVSAKRLEDKILGGKVEVEPNEAGYPLFYWRPSGWKQPLPLLNVSSMVSELASVAIYLRNYVSSGDLLIFEEPEAHLHPSKQVQLMREVATWVRRGVRIIVTTHSEWVLEELSNLVAEGVGSSAFGIPEDQIGLWSFNSKARGGGSRVREVKWDGGEGGFTTGFEKVAAKQYNKWISLIGEAE